MVLFFPSLVFGGDNADYQYVLSKCESDSEYFGAYKAPEDLNRGKKIYIFPDKTFAIVGFCDICVDELLAKGKYIYSDSKIALLFESPYAGKKSVTYHLRIGFKNINGIHKDHEYLMLDDQQLLNFSYEKDQFSILNGSKLRRDWKRKSQWVKENNIKKI